jgi:2,3-dihydroxybenzoate-AMP ligase
MALDGFTPWPDDFARRYRQKGYWAGAPLPAVFGQLAARQPDREVIAEGGRRARWSDIWSASSRLAVQLARLGLKKHDRVVFQLPNGIDFFVAFLALTRIGAIPVMALPPHRETELVHFAKASGAVALFIPERLKDFDYRPMAKAVQAAAPTVSLICVQGQALAGQLSLPELAAIPAEPAQLEAIDAIPLESDDVVLMLLSGGTTALPKLIPRSHDDYIYNFKQSARVAGFGADTVFLAVLPMAHNYTLGSPGFLGALAWGGRVVIAPKADCETVFGLVQSEGVTAIAAAVPLAVLWLNDPQLDRFDVSTLKVVQNGGARLSPELRQRLRQRLGCQFQEVYGTAEGLLNLTRLDDSDDRVLNSSGAPMCEDDEIKILDADDRELPDGEAGELVVRGPYTIRGYYNAPEVNARAFTADGFYRMGDVVKKFGRTLVTEGRKKDLINRGGEKISTDEVENFILKHPAIKGVAVVAMSDAVFGEKACACVTLKQGQKLSFEDLQQFLLAQKIAKFKLPERLEVLDEFPLSPAGKILRRDLREMVDQNRAAEAAQGERNV